MDCAWKMRNNCNVQCVKIFYWNFSVFSFRSIQSHPQVGALIMVSLLIISKSWLRYAIDWLLIETSLGYRLYRRAVVCCSLIWINPSLPTQTTAKQINSHAMLVSLCKIFLFSTARKYVDLDTYMLWVQGLLRRRLVILNDPDHRNGRYFALFDWIR